MDDRLLFLMSKAQHTMKNYVRREFTNGGVEFTPAQMGILFALKLKNGLSMNILSEIVSIDNAAVTRHVDTLERNGLITRTQDPEDRRKYMVSITEKGISEADKSKEIVRKINSMLKEGFSEEEVEVYKRMLNSFFVKFK
ncbi:MAG: MarR family transcriptional regulator [Spirochaetes bacterium]|nr:MarR family transcriptional regulator [Spirochaetota bacterium]